MEELEGQKQLEGFGSRQEHLWGIGIMRSVSAAKRQVQTPPAVTE